MAADLALDVWRYYGSKKLSDVDIILAEEEPASAAGSTATEPDQQAAPDSAADAAATGGSDSAGTQATKAAAAAEDDSVRKSSKRKRQEGEHICGHSLVLATLSGYCRTKLEDWDDATDTADQHGSSSNSSSSSSRSSRARHEIQLLVPAGQLEAGRLLIRGMYQQRPDLSDVSQAQLIQLLLLADRFEVPKVQAAVSAAFKALPREQLQWDTAVAAYSLPAGCAELAACQDLFSTVAAKLQHELGDLELVLTEPGSSKAQQLLGLPFGALKQLLRDERTRVSSENTVFYAIQQWHAHQQQQIMAKCSEQQRERQLQSLQQQAKELLQLVRMLQCSQLFIATVVGRSELAAGCFSRSDLLLASQFGRSAIGQRALPANAAKLPELQRHPAWLLPARPPSAMTQLTIDWQLPLAQLKEAFEQQLETGETTCLCGDIRVWQGLRVYQQLESTSDSSDGTTMRLLDVFCKAHLKKMKNEPSECRSAATGFRAKSFMHGVPDVVMSGPDQDLYSNTSLAWGYRGFVQLGAVNSWAEAEVVLRNRGLVGGDGCLHLAMTVSNTVAV